MSKWQPPSMPPDEVVEGTTKPLRFRLEADGEPIPLAGLTLALVLVGADGVAVATATKITVIDDGTAPLRGLVDYAPASGDFAAARSPYSWRWEVTDGAGKKDYYPRGERAAKVITVHPR